MRKLSQIFAPVGKLVPMLRKYLSLDQEEKELKPKVEAAIRDVMANGDTARKKKISENLTERLKQCKIEVQS